MNVRLALASLYVPGFEKRRRLGELLRRTAQAFGVPAPKIAGQSYGACLRTFATFTAWRVEAGPASESSAREVRARLRADARVLGRDIGRALHVRTRAEGMQAARVVYRMLGIDFRGESDGTIVIRRCGFSDIYTPRACALVSGLDEGLLAGLLGEGRLEFSSRITEGCDRCAATFRFEGAP